MNEDLLVIKKNEVPAIQFNKEELIERVDEILGTTQRNHLYHRGYPRG